MGWMCGHRFRLGVLALALGMATAMPVAAEVTTEKSASILIFPKLLFTDDFDSIVQISNTSNNLVYAHCFYVDARLLDPSQPPGPFNPALWQEVDFDITLTRQQPTHWVISLGRTTDPFDPTCTFTNQDCNDAGIDPGRIPPVSPGFQGELKCIEVDQSGAPISGNHLKGEATLLTLPDPEGDFAPGDVSKYNAVGVIGLDSNDSNTVLCLGGGVSAKCPFGAEYQGCPDVVLLSHFAENTSNPMLEEFGQGRSNVNTEITIVPCTQDYENQLPSRVTIQFRIVNEFEEPFSTSTTVECWGNWSLQDVNPVLTVGSLGTRFIQTFLRPAGGTASSFVAVQEEFHVPVLGMMEQPARRVAFNTHVIGERTQADLVTIPEGP